MKIYDLQISQENGDIKLSVSIESKRLGFKQLWFSTPAKYGEYLCKTRMDGFLVGMLFPAMQYGEDIHIEGCVSRRLLFNLNNYVVPLLITFSPSCKRIKITAAETSTERFDCEGIGTGFSGGVDSFCTIYDRLELENSPDYKINSFLFLNVGSHGPGEGQEQEDCLEFAKRKFLTRYNHLKQFPDEVGLDFIPLDSNLHAFHPWGHLKTYTLTIAAGILVLQANYSKYYYATGGLNYDDMLTNANHYKDIADGGYCEPILLPLLSTESLNFILDGGPYTRVEKILHIINYEPVQRYLNVCVSAIDTWENCSVCVKCCRTLMTLNSIGKIDQFRHLFDIAKYKKKAEQRYVLKQIQLRKKDPFARGNIALAKQHGVKLPSFLLLVREFIIRILRLFLSPSAIKKIKGWQGKLFKKE